MCFRIVDAIGGAITRRSPSAGIPRCPHKSLAQMAEAEREVAVLEATCMDPDVDGLVRIQVVEQPSDVPPSLKSFDPAPSR